MGHSAVQGAVNIVPVFKEKIPQFSKEADFSTFRSLVPLVADDKVIHCNAAYLPPSNLIVHDAITNFTTDALYNPDPTPRRQRAVKETRELVGRCINADSSSIALTRDTTEALGCFIRSFTFKPGDNVIILDTEHPNQACGWMAMRRDGLEVRQVPTIPEAQRTGNVTAANAATFAPYVDERTKAIGLSSIMFHSGQWNDVADICNTFRPRGIHVFVDLTQHIGFAQVDVEALGVSAAGFSLYKGMNCPTGFAALYVDPKMIESTDPTPPIVGCSAISNLREDLLVPCEDLVYHSSARRYERLGLNMFSVVAARAFLTFYLDTMGPKRVQEHLYRLGDVLREECDNIGVRIVGPLARKDHAPHLYVLDLHHPSWMSFLKESGVLVTPYRLGIRVSFGFYNNTLDVIRLANVLKAGIDSGIPLS